MASSRFKPPDSSRLLGFGGGNTAQWGKGVGRKPRTPLERGARAIRSHSTSARPIMRHGGQYLPGPSYGVAGDTCHAHPMAGRAITAGPVLIRCGTQYLPKLVWYRGPRAGERGASEHRDSPLGTRHRDALTTPETRNQRGGVHSGFRDHTHTRLRAEGGAGTLGRDRGTRNCAGQGTHQGRGVRLDRAILRHQGVIVVKRYACIE